MTLLEFIDKHAEGCSQVFIFTLAILCIFFGVLYGIKHQQP